jgi:hypothetical protein
LANLETPGVRQCILCLLLAPLIARCSLSLGAMTSAAGSEPNSYHTGFTTQGMVSIPSANRFVVGVETATLFQTSPGIDSDLWRLGFIGGYAPQQSGRLGVELLGRAQYMRGAQGNFNPAGFVFGCSVGLPWAFAASTDPWEVEELSGMVAYLVPSLGINGIVGSRQNIHPEVFFSLSIRFAATSTLLP